MTKRKIRTKEKMFIFIIYCWGPGAGCVAGANLDTKPIPLNNAFLMKPGRFGLFAIVSVARRMSWNIFLV